jgi:hypothetical protein
MNMRGILTKLAAISEAPALNPKDIENKTVDIAAQWQKNKIGAAAGEITDKFDKAADKYTGMSDQEALKQPGVTPENLPQIRAAWADYKKTRAGQAYGNLPGQKPLASLDKDMMNKMDPKMKARVQDKNAPRFLGFKIDKDQSMPDYND